MSPSSFLTGEWLPLHAGHSMSTVPSSQPTISDFKFNKQRTFNADSNKLFFELVKVLRSYIPYKITTLCGQ